MKIEEPDLSGTYSYADYVSWQWAEMTELIRGKIYKMSPAPSSIHQKISGKLFLEIGNFLKGNTCQLFAAPFDVRLPVAKRTTNDEEINTVVQPDLCVICDPSKIDDRGCLGAPDWVIEILSAHTSTRDLREKFDVYEEVGVREYWVVHPIEQTVLVYVLDHQGKYKGLLKPFVRTDTVSPVTIPGLAINLEDVFERVG